MLDVLLNNQVINNCFELLSTEPPINTLNELSKAMRDSGLQLLVEVQSASQAMLEVRIVITYFWEIRFLTIVNTYLHSVS